MPHTSKDAQKAVEENGGLALTVGDLCREHYVPIVRAFHTERRWTTVHNQLKGMFGLSDGQAAKILAFLEFYRLEASKYEDEKIQENGRAE